MARVLLQLEKLQTPFNGLYTVSEQLAQSISELPDPVLDFIYYVPPAFIGQFGQAIHYRTLSKWHKKFPCLGPKVDIWHNIHQDCRYLPASKKTKLMITINDLNFLYEDFSEEEKKRRLQILQNRINKATQLIAISEYVKQDVLRHLTVNCPMEVIYTGCQFIEESPEMPRAERQIKPAFLLCLGTVLPKKNYHSILPLLQGLAEQQLIIAGGSCGSDYTQYIQQQAKQLGVAERVILLGAVTNAEKRWLYENCQALLCPSLTEGFGLPVVEAMQYGKPVFLSTFTCLPEVGAGVAYYFDDYSSEGLLQVFQQGMNDYYSTDLAERLRQRAQLFTWRQAAEQHITLYQRLSQHS